MSSPLHLVRLAPPIIAAAVGLVLYPTIAPASAASPPKPNLSICHQPGGFYPYPGDPTKFYQCDLASVPYMHSCPEGTVWNQDILVCDWPANVPGANGDETSQPTTSPPKPMK